MRQKLVCATCCLLASGVLGLAQQPPDIGKGWMAEFDHAAKQTDALAEATPAEKFSWRPAPGVRSTGEVYMHIALGNYFLLRQAGVKIPAEVAAKITPKAESEVTAKPDILKWLKDSQDLVRQSYGQVDMSKKVTFFGSETTVEGIFLRILVHNHEHMGQEIAYARMMGVKPPWSRGE